MYQHLITVFKYYCKSFSVMCQQKSQIYYHLKRAQLFTETPTSLHIFSTYGQNKL